MKTKTKRRKALVTKKKKAMARELKAREMKKEIDEELKPGKRRQCRHCGMWNPALWTDPILCVFCFHKLDGSERESV